MTTRVLALVYIKGISIFHEHTFCTMLPLNYSRIPYYNSNTCINSRIKWESKRFNRKREHVQKHTCHAFLAMCQMLTMVAAVWKEGMTAYIGVRLTLFCSDTAHEGKTRRVSKFAHVNFLVWHSFSFISLRE